MKKILLLIFVCSSLLVKAQDSTWVTNITLTQRAAIAIFANEANYNDSLRTRLQNKFSVNLKANFVSVNNIIAGTATITIDSIPTTILSDAYQILTTQLVNTNQSVIATDLKTELVTPRANNNYLNTLCTATETANTANVLSKLKQWILSIIQRQY